jgi:hypothetical protein
LGLFNNFGTPHILIFKVPCACFRVQGFMASLIFKEFSTFSILLYHLGYMIQLYGWSIVNVQ